MQNYPVDERFDEKTKMWIYTITMPLEDKNELEKICSEAGLTIEDTLILFFKWLIAEPRAAMEWLRRENV